MVQQTSNPQDLSSDLDDHVARLPTAWASQDLSEFSEQSADRPAAGPQVRVSRRDLAQIVVLEVAGRLCDVVDDLDQAIQLGLADGPRGVVCDLSAALGGAQPAAAEVLAMAGRHVRDWSGIPVAVSCPDPRVRRALAAYPLSGHLIVTGSLSSAVSAVQATHAVAVEWLHLAPHRTAPRAARDFVTRTLLDWRLGRVIPFASLAVSELVADSMHAGTDISLSLAWNLGALRLTVRDDSPDLQCQHYSHLDPHGRRLSVVAVLSRAFGVLPTPDGGKVVWAVLNAARPHGV
jgi:hypothetical protein